MAALRMFDIKNPASGQDFLELIRKVGGGIRLSVSGLAVQEAIRSGEPINLSHEQMKRRRDRRRSATADTLDRISRTED